VGKEFLHHGTPTRAITKIKYTNTHLEVIRERAKMVAQSRTVLFSSKDPYNKMYSKL